MKTRAALSLLALVTASVAAFANAADPFERKTNVVYAERDGIGLVMDIFIPTSNANGLGIVDVASGAWHSDRGKLRDHERAKFFDIFCGKGYTVFAVRPGSITKFSGEEMLANVKDGIRWVKEHAGEYKVDPNRLGLTGASAGGHLACLASVAPDRDSKDSTVKATAVFFPPTDFLDWGGVSTDPRKPGRASEIIRALAFRDGVEDLTDEKVKERITAVSPARRVTKDAPPFLIIHGDADPLVPLQQSEVMVAALKGAEVPVELIVKKGGGHPWMTIHEEVLVIANWFDKQLQPSAESK